jgi:hypothetical protein
MKRIEFVPLVAASLMAASPQKMPHIVTYRDAGCGCCEGWLNAARAAGYPVELHDLDRAERLRRFRLSDATAGCHTSLTDGYIIEVPGMDGPRAGGSDILTLEPRPQVYARV